MNRRLAPAALALALLPLAGCAGREPTEALVVIAGPKAFSSFEVRDADDRVLWRVVADTPAPVAELFYGDTPPGFRREIPDRGSTPRPLVVGEPLSLSSVTPLRVFHHEGFVSRGRQLSIEHWAMTLRNPPSSTEQDSAPAPPYQ